MVVFAVLLAIVFTVALSLYGVYLWLRYGDQYPSQIRRSIFTEPPARPGPSDDRQPEQSLSSVTFEPYEPEPEPEPSEETPPTDYPTWLVVLAQQQKCSDLEAFREWVKLIFVTLQREREGRFGGRATFEAMKPYQRDAPEGQTSSYGFFVNLKIFLIDHHLLFSQDHPKPPILANYAADYLHEPPKNYASIVCTPLPREMCSVQTPADIIKNYRVERFSDRIYAALVCLHTSQGSRVTKNA